MQSTLRFSRSRENAERAAPLKRSRFWLLCLCFALWAVAIGGRLFWLQIVRHGEYVERAHKQQESSMEIPPRRGILYDRNLHELAMTVQVDSLYAVPGDIDDKPAVAHQLASLVHTDPEDTETTEEQILARLNSERNSIRVARGLTRDVAARVAALNLKGIYALKESQRFYPNSEIAAQVLGYVGIDDVGLGGIEQKFEKQLHGVPGHMNKAMDARRHVMGSIASEPQPGRNLELTIDENIQFLAERALDHAMERTRSQYGTVVVQDSHTGQILALAIRPTFNPNLFRRTTPELLRNHAVSDVYEPGSTFKLVAYAAALDQHVTTPDDIVDCQGGQITIAGRVIHDNQGEHFGRIPVHEALEHSSDVGAIKMALKVGQDKFYQYVRDFGFGARTGVEMPGETRGLLRPVSKWSASSIGSIAMGQEVGVTPLQLVSMVTTIADGGVYLSPHILMPGQLDGTPATAKAQPFKPGGDLPNPLPPGAHRVISTMAAAQMRKMMEGVVLYGTGKAAQLNGYSSGGKTGTAQKVDPATHLYSKTMHIASFAGFAPVNNPVISVAIVMDSPKGDYYGASVSAPVFTEVAQQVLEYLSVPHDIEIRPVKKTAEKKLVEDEGSRSNGDIDALRSAASELPADDPLNPATSAKENLGVQQSAGAAKTQTAGTGSAAQQGISKTVTFSQAGLIRVPSFLGLPVRKIVEQSAAAGLEVEITGNGMAREQNPLPGTMVAPGTHILVRCRR